MDETPKVEVTAPNPQPQATTPPPHHKFPKFALLAFVVLLFAAFGGSMVLFYQSQSPQTQPTSTIVSPTTIPQQTETTENWKTYKNEEYGFEFKYPQDGKLSEEKFTGLLRISVRSSIDDISFDLEVKENTKKRTAHQIKEEKFASMSLGDNHTSPEDGALYAKEEKKTLEVYEIGEIRGAITQLFSIPHLEVVFTNGKYMYEFRMHANSEADKFESHKIKLDQILSTFQFIDSDNTPNTSLKTYQNQEYGYSFQYPTTWRVGEKMQEGFKNVGIYSPDNKLLIEVNRHWFAMGCGGDQTLSEISQQFQIGSETKSVKNFCGTDFYITNIHPQKLSDPDGIQLVLRFVGTQHEQTAREVLKSLTF